MLSDSGSIRRERAVLRVNFNIEHRRDVVSVSAIILFNTMPVNKSRYFFYFIATYRDWHPPRVVVPQYTKKTEHRETDHRRLGLDSGMHS
jgi:hypothetical protein